MNTHQFWTPLGVRLRAHRRRAGECNWLFLPGGPGIGSESLTQLVDAADVPGTSWLVDLPGDGSNTKAPGAPTNPYRMWPDVLLEAATAVADPVFVGHSTGGMYLLSVPGLQSHLRGLVLISSAPDAGWKPLYKAMTTANPLPAVDAAADRYERDPTVENLRALAVASAPWNFNPEGLAAGTDLLSAMPYNTAAVEWSDLHFDNDYVSSWWPSATPTLVVSGTGDRIVNQGLWNDPRYAGRHVLRRPIQGGGHWPWLERPLDVRAAFGDFIAAM
jgi:pimeloyl-ACP methyl ester carboxylesterase